MNFEKVRPHMNLIKQLYATVSEDCDFEFGDLCHISTFSVLLSELSTEKQETRNLVKNILESRDALANLMAQLVKSKESEIESEMCGDFSKRVIGKLLDISKVNLTYQLVVKVL